MIRRNEAERMLVTVRTFAYVAIDEDRRPRKVPGSANGLRVKLIGVGKGSRVWRDNLGETAAAIGMGCGGRVRREGRRDSFRTQAIFDCR